MRPLLAPDPTARLRLRWGRPLAPIGDYTSNEILGAHVAFLRLMVEAMAPAVLPLRSDPLEIGLEARAVRTALQTVIGAASQTTLETLESASHRIRSRFCDMDPALARRVAGAQRRILRAPTTASWRPIRTDTRVEIFALWMLATALITTSASEDRLLRARVTAERALAALGENADKATRLSIGVQVDFYDACLGAFTPTSSAGSTVHQAPLRSMWGNSSEGTSFPKLLAARVFRDSLNQRY